MKINTVLFDLDGTLFDTAPDLLFALNSVRASYGKAPLDFSTVRHAAAQGSKGLLKAGFNIDETDPLYPKLREQFIEIYTQYLARETHLFEGIDHVLNELDRRHIPWGIVTNKPFYLTILLLKKFNLDTRSQCTVGGDTLSKQKPDAEPLLYACKQLKKQPQECIYVGDSIVDVQSSRAANIKIITALYGYIDAKDNPLSWQSDDYINHPLELLERFDRL